MSSSADRDNPSPNALGDARSFGLSMKPSFRHESAASGSSVYKDTFDSPIKTVKSGRIQTFVVSSEEEDNVKPISNEGGSHIIEEIECEDSTAVHVISSDSDSDGDPVNTTSNLANTSSISGQNTYSEVPWKIINVRSKYSEKSHQIYKKFKKSHVEAEVPWKIINVRSKYSEKSPQIYKKFKKSHVEAETPKAHPVAMPSRKRVQPKTKVNFVNIVD